MKKSILLFSGFALAALIFVSMTFVEFGKKETTDTAVSEVQTGGYNIGDIATDFRLKSVNENLVSLADFPEAKGYIVIFTCNSCPYAVLYEDRIIELHNKYAAKGYPVIAINPNDPELKPEDSFSNMQQRAKEKQFPFPYIFDEKQEIFPQYGATKTPHVFLLSKERVVEYIGAIDDNSQDASAVKVKYVENAITALEKGEKPDPTITKAIGCSIKFKK